MWKTRFVIARRSIRADVGIGPYDRLPYSMRLPCGGAHWPHPTKGAVEIRRGGVLPRPLFNENATANQTEGAEPLPYARLSHRFIRADRVVGPYKGVRYTSVGADAHIGPFGVQWHFRYTAGRCGHRPLQ